MRIKHIYCTDNLPLRDNFKLKENWSILRIYVRLLRFYRTYYYFYSSGLCFMFFIQSSYKKNVSNETSLCDLIYAQFSKILFKKKFESLF